MHPKVSKLFCSTLLVVWSIGFIADSVLADNKYKGRAHHGHGHGGGFTGLAVTPAGIGVSFQNRNFGIAIAPGTLRSLYHGYGGGGDYIDPDYYASPGYIAEPAYSPAFVEPAVLPIGVSPLAPNHPVPLPSEVGRSYAEAPTFIPTNQAANLYQAAAEEAFRNRDYRAAARSLQHALLEDPQNGYVHLFAAQVAFAMGEYETANQAATIATQILNSTDWFHVVKNFRQFYRGDDYVVQMDRLNSFCEEYPNRSYAQSLRAFHFFGLGHPDAANQMAQKAIDSNRDDRLAQTLLSQVPQRVIAPSPKESRLTNDVLIGDQ